MSEPAPLIDTLNGLVESWDPQRHPVIRSGERERISPAVRRAVLRRDGERCDWCDRGGLLEMDHIVPWSAGGSDRSENLRPA